MNDYGEQQINLEPENVEQQIELEEEPVIINQGGTQNYNELRNKPSINGVELRDNKTSQELGLADDDDITDLQEQIDAITVSSDVVDVLGTYQDLLDYDTSELGDNDIVKVLQDSTHGNAMSYYRWNKTAGQWVYVGSEGPFYTKSESDTKFQDKLVSGTNIKTINNESILGSGNIDIEGGYPEVPEDAYTLYNLIEIYNDETTIPDGIYTVTQDWYIDVLKQDEYSSDNIFANSLLYINRVNDIIGWSGPSSSTYWYNGDETFTGGVLTNADDVNAIIDEKLGPNIVMTDTDQDITGIKTIRATDGLKFRYGSEATRTVIKPISGGMAVAYTNAQGVTDNNFEFSQGYNTSNKTLIPGNTATQDLGKSDRVWNNLYVSKLNDGTNEKSFSSLLTNNSSLIPTSSSVYALGDNTHRWYYLYMSGNIEMQLGDIRQVKSITANEYRIKDGNFNNNYYSLLKYNYGTSGKTVAQLQNGIDVNNMVIHNIPDTPDDGTSPINKNYADTNLQGKLTAGTGISITNNVISSTLEGIDYEVDDELPQTGEKGIIYLIPNGSSETENIYDEYIWIPPLQEGESGRFEFIGTTQTDLTNYVDRTTYQTISGTKMLTGQLQFGGSSNYIQYNSVGGKIRVRTGGLQIDNGAVEPYTTNALDLGLNDKKWRNLYLSGNLSDGTNSVAVADIADKDYVDNAIGDIDTALQNLVSGNGVI